MNTFMNALLPQIHVVRGARKVSFWIPTEEFSETGMTYLQEVEHDLGVFQRRLDKAMSTGVCGQRLELIRRQRDYKRKVFLKLRKNQKRQWIDLEIMEEAAEFERDLFDQLDTRKEKT